MPTQNHSKQSERAGIKVRAQVNLKIGRQSQRPAGSAHPGAGHIDRSRLWQDARSLYAETCTAMDGWPSSRRQVAERMIGNADAIHRRIGTALAAQHREENIAELAEAVALAGEFLSSLAVYHHARQLTMGVYQRLATLATQIQDGALRLLQAAPRSNQVESRRKTPSTQGSRSGDKQLLTKDSAYAYQHLYRRYYSLRRTRSK